MNENTHYRISKDALKFMLRATSSDKYRTALGAVLFSPQGIVATDTFRLHFMSVENNPVCHYTAVGDGATTLVPSSALKLALAVKGAHSIVVCPNVDNEYIEVFDKFEASCQTIRYTPVGAPFPNWERVLPEFPEVGVQVDSNYTLLAFNPKFMTDCVGWGGCVDDNSERVCLHQVAYGKPVLVLPAMRKGFELSQYAKLEPVFALVMPMAS